jgi:hypothetical protein
VTSTQDPHHDRRWLILGVIAIAQLMVVLDVTIVNIALPSAQSDLGVSDDARQWIITAYALAFGSLLLLGGRLGDLFGRKWTFIGGLLGFAAASAVGGWRARSACSSVHATHRASSRCARASGPGAAVHHVHRSLRARHGVRHLRGHRRRGFSGRPAAGRHPHRVAVLAPGVCSSTCCSRSPPHWPPPASW